jgi:hypothetical protein
MRLDKSKDGRMGDVVFTRSPTVEAQRAYCLLYKKATAYAKVVLADPKASASYKKRAAKAKKRPRDLAISDFFKGKDLLATK